MREAISVLLMALPVIGLCLVIRNGVRSFRQPKRIVSDAHGKKKISTNPWFFDCFSRKVYFYDERYFYEIQKDRTTQIELARIVNIKPGSTMVNNRRIWSVIYVENGREKQVQFYPNVTMFNHNFSAFLIAVKNANPYADIKNLSVFNF
ncbi:hypothetical protein [Enterobacter cloacae]|uniref:hypothetical protein n=1 Tax=Enterobacter cloacae TaxID=550 RepID=UPI00188C51A9|nr:hypothetical protein [Enterobacter cloacae]MBF4111528.1 hypothetical protein [Enterobacter cloacae]MDT8890876.1 hypothetical protein [Enterobacter cloacae]